MLATISSARNWKSRLLGAGIALALSAVFSAPTLPASGQAGYRVIAHSGVPASSLDRDELSNVFLKKRSSWDNGTSIFPVTLEDREVESAFAEDVHHRSTASLKKFWQRQIFTGGGTPPPSFSSDQEVLSYVRSTPGAIGFVSSRLDVSKAGVRVIEVR
jgi:ABC-type phosphate transport system substrate-binding protein